MIVRIAQRAEPNANLVPPAHQWFFVRWCMSRSKERTVDVLGEAVEKRPHEARP